MDKRDIPYRLFHFPWSKQGAIYRRPLDYIILFEPGYWY